ncbi:hypothetical protein [Chryseobacterium potabilaquae]|uniref:hypothetical protein n=1 Tax=Chryseobacterium potabilaquae TaxID=2675057 RepID=UPI00138A02E8|nr:hypothetical protein [Chryseobacterium potabilaquae]
MSLITGKYIRKEATTKQITKERKPSFVLSIIEREMINQIISFRILTAKNFIPASGFP